MDNRNVRHRRRGHREGKHQGRSKSVAEGKTQQDNWKGNLEKTTGEKN